ncbi:unnamed protein product [Brassica napus]|uniref:(rape) hypothetical protein n=1 Tax=Brassica napus TaxID=3708 RepID=A0A816XXJ7_BRANA|nr:unnamed protein product [Brassica napus]
MYNYNVEVTSKKEVYLRNGRSWKLIRYIKTHIAILPICRNKVQEQGELVAETKAETEQSLHSEALDEANLMIDGVILSDSELQLEGDDLEDWEQGEIMDFADEDGLAVGDQDLGMLVLGDQELGDQALGDQNLGVQEQNDPVDEVTGKHINGGSVSSNNRGKKKRPSSVGFKRESDNALRMEGSEKTVLGKEEGTMDDASYSHHVIHHYFYI